MSVPTTQNRTQNRRAIILVVDAWGVGALPDAPAYGDSPACNTMGGIDREASALSLPNFRRLGLGNLLPLKNIPPDPNPMGAYGKMAEHSQGKDTTTGHWEMAGIFLETPFPTYPQGFPDDLMARFVAESGCGGYLANIPASGTAVIEDFGPQHLESGHPIVYTSADSVFQVAAHGDRVPLQTLYHWCQTARNLLQGEHRVSRVIARPFQGVPGAFERIGGDRRDFSVDPPQPMLLTRVKEAGIPVVAIGKIEDIYCGVGVTHALHTQSNTHGLEVTGQLIRRELPLGDIALNGFVPRGDYAELLFINLVDTDMKYGHRRDVAGYARALEEIDARLGEFLAQMAPDDLLLITGDHGCDPTAPGSDHTREYVPIFLYSPALTARELGVRASFADLGQTVLAWLGLPGDGLPGVSMLPASPPLSS